MKKPILILVLSLGLLTYLGAQVYIDLEDDLVIDSDSWIIFNPGIYNIPDAGNDGLLQIDGKENIILDGTGVYADGADYSGYMIKISNSSNIHIKNFGGVSHYFYAVYITGSDHITIENNDFSYNKVDSSGWISIWTNYNQALGGGVLMYQTEYAQVNNNIMKYQNDGVALYHCDSILVHGNDFAWNTSYGIRMYFTDHCDIQDNVANHINRPFTDPSDCAAILLIVSNENYVVNNDFSYSGDGIFLGQFQYSQILNNNYFAYNECSFSPHNAIEATFADGNVFEFNNCNYSHYGLWLGYSFNSLVRGNEIIGNQYAGIAIDRGYNNRIEENIIEANPTGIELWEGDGIPPYQTQNSGGYTILDNVIEGNRVAISLRKTEHSIIEGNEFLSNRNGIYVEGDNGQDSITANIFFHTAFYHIENVAPGDVYAAGNEFDVDDEEMIACSIFDQDDDPASGTVTWQPFVPGPAPVFLSEVPDDMTEPEATWYAYPEACWGYGMPQATAVEWDFQEKVFGEASVHVTTGNGWDLGIMYRPPDGQFASWSLQEEDTLTFWLKSSNSSPYGFQFCSVQVGNNCGGYYKYTAPAGAILNPTIGDWKRIRVPLIGASPWARTVFGSVSFDDISYVELHADTWDHGFELWIDAMTINGDFIFTGTDRVDPANPSQWLEVQPNPLSGKALIRFALGDEQTYELWLFSADGKVRRKLHDGRGSAGWNRQELQASGLAPGLYFCRLVTENHIETRKIIIR